MGVEATRATVLALFFLVVSFVIATNSFADQEREWTFANCLVIYGPTMAVFALVQHFNWNGSYYWLRPLTTEGATPFGPFVNRNRFVGYIEMLMPLPIAMVIARATRREMRPLYVFAATMMAFSFGWNWG